LNVALVHDYVTQRGGAERVVASMLRAFPSAPLHTSLYDPAGTFPEFEGADVRTLFHNRSRLLRRHHRWALPLLAPAFSRLQVDADAVICSSSGWAHGARVDGRKIVYCHTPARWLYQAERYLGTGRRLARASLRLLAARLREWDRHAALTADLYVCNSSIVRNRVWDAYGIEAELLPPPHTIDPTGPQLTIDGVEPGYFLCVSRLLPYKNVDAVIGAFAGLPGERLVVVGAGPEEARLRPLAGRNVRLLGSVSDDELRWLYANCVAVVAASREDYGLTPLEGAAFGKPSAVLRWGGFLDTVVEGGTGVFFDAPMPKDVGEAIVELTASPWSVERIQEHAEQYSEARFIERLRAVVLDQPVGPRELVAA
jgi:glycosyltransferase involved in cell wall biosynthesis